MLLRINKWKIALWIYLFLLFVYLTLPMIIVVSVSFTAANYTHFPPKGFSFKWFVAVFQEPTFVMGIYNSLRLAFLTIIVANLIAIPAALTLARYNFKKRDIMQSFLMSPLSLPMIILGIGLLFFSSKIGLGLSFTVLLSGHVAITIPYIFTTVFGTYRGLEPNLEESAMVLGASNFQIFRRVTFPLIRSGIIVGSIFAFIMSFDNVPVSIFLTGIKSVTLPIAVLVYLQDNFDPSVASLSTIQLFFVIVGLYILQKIYGLQKISISR